MSDQTAVANLVQPFLEGLRVVDLTEALAGPFSTAILSDLGAEVVKVERVSGDSMRRRGARNGRSLPFEMIQRNKRAVAIDFTKPAGAEALRRLVSTADVFVENFRPGVLGKYGLDQATLRGHNPSLIYCSISGFGQTGPLSEAKGVDLIAQGYGGLLSVTGAPDGSPAKAGYAISDLGAGMWAAIGILAALERRHHTKQGAYIDVSLSDAVASWSPWELADYQITGRAPTALGTAHRLTAPYQAFMCRDDKWLTLAGIDRQWPALCQLLGVADLLLEDERFATEYSRFEHREELAAILQDRFREDDRDPWIERLRTIGLPCGPVNTMPEMLADPQYRARGMFVTFKDGDSRITLVNTPIVADGAPRITKLGPSFAADTRAVLREAGLSDDELAALAADAVIACADPENAPSETC